MYEQLKSYKEVIYKDVVIFVKVFVIVMWKFEVVLDLDDIWEYVDFVVSFDFIWEYVIVFGLDFGFKFVFGVIFGSQYFLDIMV